MEIEQIPKIHRKELDPFTVRRDVKNIWGCLDNWADTVQSLPYAKVLKIYNAAITAGLIEEEV